MSIFKILSSEDFSKYNMLTVLLPKRKDISILKEVLSLNKLSNELTEFSFLWEHLSRISKLLPGNLMSQRLENF